MELQGSLKVGLGFGLRLEERLESGFMPFFSVQRISAASTLQWDMLGLNASILG